MAGAAKAKTHNARMRFILFWAQDGKCYACEKQLPHPGDHSVPMKTVTLVTLRREDGHRGDGSRTGCLVAHQMCAAIKHRKVFGLEYLKLIQSKISRFRDLSWPEIEHFLRGEICFVRFALAAELRGTENPHAHHKRPASGAQVSSES